MTKNLEIKTYQFNNINVKVEINYDKKIISLLESRQAVGREVKKYVFADRGLEYMQGWHTILDAMKSAIDAASKELKEYIDACKKKQEEEMTKIIVDMTELTNKIGKKIAGIAKKKVTPKKKK